MSDSQSVPASDPSSGRAATAGGLLRQARQAQGLHIAALAAAIKVLPRKLELLESDQLDQLPDATFTRALAHTVCRTLKIDPAPVLALLPPPRGHRLEQVSEGLNTPFRERPGRLVPKEWASVASPTLWVVGLLIIASAAVYLMPASWLSFAKSSMARPSSETQTSTPQSIVNSGAAPAELAASATPSTIDATPASGAPPADSPASPAPALAQAPIPESDAVPPASGVLQLRTTAPSWIEVTDSRGKALIARLVQPGENLGLDGVMPFKVRIGNASGTELVFRGKPLALASYTRDNVARLELK